MSFFDSHCHLDPRAFDGDAGVDAAIDRAKQAGVSHMITIGAGYGIDTAANAVAVAARHAGVWCSVGVHPHDASHWTHEMADTLREMSKTDNVVAIGEMGLDFHYDNSPRDQQRAAFRAQIALAIELGKPIIIHDRSSDGETLQILDETNAFANGVLFHCYSSDVTMMEAIVERGGFISIPGIVTFKKADMMRDVARQVPEDRLLIETDSPFLAPVPHRGKRNEPAYVIEVARQVAALRGLTPERLGQVAAANTRRFFVLT